MQEGLRYGGTAATLCEAAHSLAASQFIMLFKQLCYHCRCIFACLMSKQSNIVKGTFGSSTKKLALHGEVILPLPGPEYVASIGKQLLECLANTLKEADPDHAAMVDEVFAEDEESVYDSDEELTEDEDLSDSIEHPALERTNASAVADMEEEKQN